MDRRGLPALVFRSADRRRRGRLAVLQPDPVALYAAADWDGEAASGRARRSGGRRRRRLRGDAAQGARALLAAGSLECWRSCSRRSRSTPSSSACRAGGSPCTTPTRCAPTPGTSTPRRWARRYRPLPRRLAAVLAGSGWLLAVAFYSVFFFYKIQIVPEHFWMARRFLPVILPATHDVHRRRADGVGGDDAVWRRMRPANLPRVGVRLALAALIAWNFVESSRPILRPRRVCRHHPAPRVAGLADRRRRARWSSSRATHPIFTCSRCRWPTSTPSRCCAELAEAGQAGVCEVRRLGAAAVSPGVFPRRRRHRSAVVQRRRRASGERALSGARIRVAAERLPDARARQRNSTTASIASSRRRRRAASSRSTSATRTTSTSSASTRRNATGAARSAGRSGSHTCRSRR